MFVLTTIITLIASTAAQAQNTTTTTTTPSQEPISRSLPLTIPALSIEGGNGSVTLRAVPGTTTSRVTITPRRRWSDLCAITFGGDAAQAQVQIREGEEISGWRCAADVVIELAGNTAVDIAMNRAQVTLEGAMAPVQIDLRAGRVRGNPDEEIAITARRAGVHLWGLAAPVQVDLGVGRARLGYAQAIAGTVDAAVGLGTVRVDFPYGALIEDASTARVGWTHSAIPSRDGEPTRLQAHTTVGTVRVRTDLEALAERLTVAQH